jgi:hypothetical protein
MEMFACEYSEYIQEHISVTYLSKIHLLIQRQNVMAQQCCGTRSCSRTKVVTMVHCGLKLTSDSTTR